MAGGRRWRTDGPGRDLAGVPRRPVFGDGGTDDSAKETIFFFKKREKDYPEP